MVDKQLYILQFLKPQNILHIAKVLMPVAWLIFFVCFTAGIILGLFYSPADYQQGEMVRIMYVHVPASWWALGIYTIMAVFSALGLITRIPICFLMAKALAPIGTVFTVISLVTGSIWGKPTWGAWWVWDARLTSMLILLFLYIGYLNISHHADEERSLSTASLLLVIGWVNIPIVKWSVDWWYTLHQPASLMRLGKSAIHASMLTPLILMAIAFGAYAVALGCWRFNLLVQKRQRQREFI